MAKCSDLTNVCKVARLHEQIKHAQQELNRKLRRLSKSHGSLDSKSIKMVSIQRSTAQLCTPKKGAELAVDSDRKELIGKIKP